MPSAAAAWRSPARGRAGRSSSIRWDRVGRVALLGTLVVILLLYVSPAKHWIEQSATARDHRRELREVTRDKRSLERRVRALQGPEALEREARKLGMVRRGERAFVIENLSRP